MTQIGAANNRLDLDVARATVKSRATPSLRKRKALQSEKEIDQNGD